MIYYLKTGHAQAQMSLSRNLSSLILFTLRIIPGNAWYIKLLEWPIFPRTH